MLIRPGSSVTITDPFIVGCLTKHRRLLPVVEELLTLLCRSIEIGEDAPEDSLASITNDVVSRVDERISDMTTLLKSQLLDYAAIAHSNTQSSLERLQADSSELKSKVDAIVLRSASTARKGAEGQNNVFELLASSLASRDGYSVEQVHGKARQCDIVVRHRERGDARVEVKNYQSVVPSAEVDKFQRDLLACGSHGIMVSVNTKIAGHRNFEVQQLSSGRFAVYLGCNDYDADQIVEALELLYTLEGLTKDRPDGVTFDPETLNRVKESLSSWRRKIVDVKGHLQHSLAILEEFAIEEVEKILGLR